MKELSARYSFLTKSAKIKLSYESIVHLYCYSFLTKSAKIKHIRFIYRVSGNQLHL